MAIRMHFVTIGMKPITAVGTVLDKNTATIKAMTQASSELRILEDSDLPNTSGFPTIEDYLTLEAAGNFVIYYLGQNFIITYHAADVKNAT